MMMEVASAVRIPSPEPELPEPPRKRDRSPYEPGPSKRSRHDDEEDRAPERPRDRERDGDRHRRRDHLPQREKENGARPTDNALPEGDARLKLFQNAFSATRKLAIDDSKTRAGGAYIPPAKLRAMQAGITDKSTPEFQRMAWEATKKSIQGLINKCNVGNIKMIVPEIFSENIVRARGPFCRSIMKAQATSITFTNILAAMIAIVNTKLPIVGDLLVRRLIVQFRKAFKRNDKAVAVASSTFLAHLVNHQVVTEVLVAEILLLLLNKPTDDSVEIAVGIMKEAGQFMEEMNSPITNAIFDQFRNILHEADIDKRTQYMIEVLFQVRKDKYKDYLAVKEELDLVEEEDQITHRHSLDGDAKTEDMLNIFKFDPQYEEHEDEYRKLKAEILGEEEGSDEDEDDEESDEDEEDEEEKAMEVKDQTNADLVSLRRTIYLTLKSSGGFEEAVHKLLRITIPPELEKELTDMIIQCASQERTYEKFYGQIAERLCKLNRTWTDLFQDDFIRYYETCHRLETNRIRIVSTLFAYLLATDAIGWYVLHCIKLNEEDTTSSSRIFVKVMFEELLAILGKQKMVERMTDPTLAEDVAGIFPTEPEKPADTRFSINFFTAIGMGELTEGMRTALQRNAALLQAKQESDADADSVSSYSSYSSRSSRSRSPVHRRRRDSRSSSRGRSYSRSPSRRRYASGSRSRSRSPILRGRDSRSYSSDRSRSRAPVRRDRNARSVSRGRSYTKSRSPVRHPSDSRSRSPAPRRRKYSSSPASRSSRSPSRAPQSGRKRYSSSPSRSPSPAPRRKRYSSSPSRSPPRRR
ncbi:MIF4G-domain-containing protein [Polyplosphaeria fusca]|uniref:Pre-mRNA-splicing factor CWC22 n=1 Tax=Polyplosphaeria fusca TaxID=682080 RepID=A0A9P4UXU8_9PLEO|nr:MIF4G-domain-containing protein [Polyplosphaeria fusca]